MKMFRARWCVLLGMACVAGLASGPAALCGWAEKVATMPAPAGYVDDYAGVLSGPVRTELDGLCTEVHDKTKAQIFFVTVKTLDGEEMEAFANELFHKWKIGEKKTDRGILLVLAIKEHKRRIEVGYGFEAVLNDAKAGDIGREMVPSLQASNYDEAARIGVDEVAKIIAADSQVTLAGLSGAGQSQAEGDQRSDVAPPIQEGTGKSSSQAFLPIALFSVLFFSGFGLFAWVVMMNIRRGVRFGGGGGSGSSGDSGSSFGGDSGGSSDSFGGGDGGDSGGGGAGGSW